MTERSDDELDSVIAEMLQAAESGVRVNRDEIVARYPQLAAELKEFFANHDLMSLASPSAANLFALQHDSRGAFFAVAGARASGPPAALADANREAPTLSGLAARTEQLTISYEQFGDYELLQEIARGGMGIVYKARQKRLNRIVALKMILSGPLANAGDIARFYAEAESAARLQHSGIVPIHEVGQYGGVHFYTMSFIEGTSLAEVIQKGPLDPIDAARLLKKIAAAVAYAHQHQVIHRDIKPGNILLDAQGEPLITDFGLAKRLDSGQELTASGQILGTLQYMPPEQARGQHSHVTASADIYALGAVLYAMLTGRPPFQAANHFDLLLQVLEGEPIAARKLNPRVPRELQRICCKCLEKDLRRRYASAEELATDLDLFLRGEPLQQAETSLIYAARKLPRRSPALCAHLIGIFSVELLRQLAEAVQGFENVKLSWQYHFQFTGIFALWALACFPFQYLLNRSRWSDLAKFMWAGADVLFVTWILALADGDIGPLCMSFAVLIVASVSFFRARLVAFMTIASLAAFSFLLMLRPTSVQPLHYALICGAMLAVIGGIMGYHVRRMRMLSDYYDRRSD